MTTEACCLSWSSLDRLLPMSLVVTKTGHIVHVGRTMAKLRASAPLQGIRFLEAFQLLRPKPQNDQISGLRELSGQPLRLSFRDNPQTLFRGVSCELEQFGGLLINMSFGISDFDAVDDYRLNWSDFSPTDLTFDMAFLREAKLAVEFEYRVAAENLTASKKSAELRALKDPLTGLGNRAAMDARLDWLLQRDMGFSVMCIDLDLFKEVNDTHGHAAGDAVLKEVANRLQPLVQSDDLVTRTGGDEFVIILRGAQDADRLSDLADETVSQLELPISFGSVDIRISGSIGCNTSARYSSPCKESILADTDAALYAAKRGGKSCSVWHQGG